MRKDIMSVLDLFKREGLRLRLPDDQRHDHQRGARRSAGGPGRRRLPEAHQRLDRRPRRAARRARGLKGTFDAHDRRSAPAAGGGPPQARAAARQHQHDRRAREPRGARPDGRRRRGTGRRCDRAQSPDVQHAGGSGRDRAAHRGEGRVGDRDVRDVGPGTRHRARAREGRRARREVPDAEHPLRLPPQGPPAADRELLHARREARRPLPVSLPPRAVSASRARYTSVRSSASKSAISRRRRSKRSGTATLRRDAQAAGRARASFRSAAAAARSNCRPSRSRSRFPRRGADGAPFR